MTPQKREFNFTFLRFLLPFPFPAPKSTGIWSQRTSFWVTPTLSSYAILGFREWRRGMFRGCQVMRMFRLQVVAPSVSWRQSSSLGVFKLHHWTLRSTSGHWAVWSGQWLKWRNLLRIAHRRSFGLLNLLLLENGPRWVAQAGQKFWVLSFLIAGMLVQWKGQLSPASL